MVAVEEVKARYHGIAACLNLLSPLLCLFSFYSRAATTRPKAREIKCISSAAILLRPREGCSVLVYVWRTGSPGYGEPGDR